MQSTGSEIEGGREHRAATTSPEQTAELGRRLAPALRAGDVLLLDGPLGAGKTVLVRGLVAGLDERVAELVASQSYVIAGEYPTSPPVAHLDLYRLTRSEEVVALGFEEIVYGDRITVVEWPGLLEPLLEPDDPVARVRITVESSGSRAFSMTSSTPRLEQALARLGGPRGGPRD